MPKIHQLFRCIGEAVCANGIKALAGLVPMGAVVFDIAENTCQRLRESQQDDLLTDLAEGNEPTIGFDVPTPRTEFLASSLVLERVGPRCPPQDERLERFLNGAPGAYPWLLDLTNKRIGDAGAVALAESPRLAGVTMLVLSGCDLSDAGVEALVSSPHLTSLTRLTLWDNHITDRGLSALASCPRLQTLTTLDLGRNEIGDEGVIELAGSPHFTQLSALILVSNRIGDLGARALAESPHLAGLAELKPLDNRITDVGVAALKRRFANRVRIM